MYKCLIFAGTVEGRRLAGDLASAGVLVTASVATEYGEKIIAPQEGLTVHQGRMDQEEMEAFMKAGGFGQVVDATHPYAAAVSENIRAACRNTGIPCLRLLRESEEGDGDWISVSSAREAAEYLNHTEGNVLLTTGSKELKEFTIVKDYQTRLFPRVLSTAESVLSCVELGFEGKNLICMQGPFSEELNTAMLRQIGASYMVTKETGKSGGFGAKLAAARKAGVKVIVIGRPVREEGLSPAAVREVLAEKWNLTFPVSAGKPEVILAGMGMGSHGTMTVEAAEACREADAVLGADRMLEYPRSLGKPVFASYKNDELKAYIDSHPEYRKVVILLSGDIGFYSGAKKLLRCLEGYPVKTMPGISSVVYFCGRLGISWEDVKLLSLHGKEGNMVGAVARNRKVFALTGGTDGVSRICRQFVEYGLSHVTVYVGERLSYPDERITQGSPAELAEQTFDSLCVVLVENPEAGSLPVTHGLDDELFIRGKVPMTKGEVRSVSLSRLRLKQDSVVYDVGAGTGSVSIEMALQAWEGMVYAIEKNPEAVALIGENQKKFRASNIQVVEGLAPEAMEDLPAPTHAFIGGSSGNLKEIMELLLRKNPACRIVINAIALESVAETLNCLKALPVTDVDISSVTAARSKALGRYHMMMGQNPVYIISCTGGSDDDDA